MSTLEKQEAKLKEYAKLNCIKISFRSYYT